MIFATDPFTSNIFVNVNDDKNPIYVRKYRPMSFFKLVTQFTLIITVCFLSNSFTFMNIYFMNSITQVCKKKKLAFVHVSISV